jgi:hypothetical protein
MTLRRHRGDRFARMRCNDARPAELRWMWSGRDGRMALIVVE